MNRYQKWTKRPREIDLRTYPRIVALVQPAGFWEVFCPCCWRAERKTWVADLKTFAEVRAWIAGHLSWHKENDR